MLRKLSKLISMVFQLMDWCLFMKLWICCRFGPGFHLPQISHLERTSLAQVSFLFMFWEESEYNPFSRPRISLKYQGTIQVGSHCFSMAGSMPFHAMRNFLAFCRGFDCFEQILLRGWFLTINRARELWHFWYKRGIFSQVEVSFRVDEKKRVPA